MSHTQSKISRLRCHSSSTVGDCTSIAPFVRLQETSYGQCCSVSTLNLIHTIGENLPFIVALWLPLPAVGQWLSSSGLDSEHSHCYCLHLVLWLSGDLWRLSCFGNGIQQMVVNSMHVVNEIKLTDSELSSV